jgi:DUF4097 and DUF4098 domain-containing protein YvlB
MNRRTRVSYLLLAAVVLAACGGHERRSGASQRQVTVTRTWAAKDIREIRVFEVSGSVKVEAAPTTEISLVAKAKGDLELKKGAENDGLFETSVTNGTLRIGRRERKRDFDFNFFFGRDEVQIDYVLRVPPTVSLDMQTVNGRIATRGQVEGTTEASTVNGTIDVEVAGLQELTATTVNGRVRAKFTRSFNGARFKSVNGGVEAILPNDASFSIDLAQVNGDFEASFPLSIHSQPGSRRVSGEVNGGQHRLKIVTVNGDVELTKLNDSL